MVNSLQAKRHKVPSDGNSFPLLSEIKSTIRTN